jgi:hypothetical protein
MGEPDAHATRLELLRVIARFAWPCAFVAVAAMTFAYLRSRPGASDHDVRVQGSNTVVRSLHDMARLETTALHVEKVIDVKDRQEFIHGLVQTDDALLFVASGEVVIGVDLGRLRDEDVRFDEATKTAYITLPEPEVLSARFDEAHSYVRSRDTGLLAKRNESLESVARRQAVAAFEAAGREKDVTARAKEQAEKELRALGSAWGARAVVVTWRPLAPSENH